MGIIADAAAILLGAIVGRIFKSKAVFGQTDIFGIGIIIISIAGVIENLFWISDGKIKGEGVLAVVAALIVGYIIGELLKIEERITKIPSEKRKLGGFVDATVFFGIGGLQICGPILLGAQNDSTQLYIKSIIDFPFAVMFGQVVDMFYFPLFDYKLPWMEYPQTFFGAVFNFADSCVTVGAIYLLLFQYKFFSKEE